MSYTKRLRPYLDHFRSLGISVDDITISGSNHYKVSVTHKGNRRFFIVAYSTSDGRSFANWKSDVRKWLRATSSRGGKDRIAS